MAATKSAKQRGLQSAQPIVLAPVLVACLTETRYNFGLFGGIAQLGERLHGMQEVSGSIPLTSTKFQAVMQYRLVRVPIV